MKKTVCFAYFADGNFLGWYSDSFGTITKWEPKLYGYTPEQVEVITKNFRYKMKKLKEDWNLRKFNPGLAILDASIVSDAKKLAEYDEVKLCVVECPIYDGPNPNFDKERHENWSVYDRKPFYEPENQNWVHADYQLVKGWAMSKPTVFLEVIYNTIN
jgi:hypothetical protein